MKKSDLPFGSEFSPAQIDLSWLLDLAAEHGGDWHAFEAAVREEYFRTPERSEYNQKKLANNTKLSMQAYGIIDGDANLTEFGQELYATRDQPGLLSEGLGRHILLNLHGLNLVQCVLDMQLAGQTVELTGLREWLEERGVHFPRGGKHPSILRLWLERAGVFYPGGWRVNRARLDDLLGVGMEEVEALSNLNAEQRSFLKALVNLTDLGPFQSNQIEQLARATYGTRFNEKTLPKDVLHPLRDQGFITLERGERTPGGRGGKPSLVTPTEKLRAEVLAPILAQLEQQIRPDLRAYLRRPLAEIKAELSDPSKHVRGLALEALAIRLMRLIDLQYVATRLRASSTGGAEVDVIFESARLVFSRWQVQCKNCDRVSLEDVAKEVGLTHMLKSNVIIIVSTGKVGPEARKYANRIMADSNLAIAMVDRDDLDTILATPPAIVAVLNREAHHAMELKKLEME